MITKVLYRVFAWDGGNLDYIDIVFTAESRTFCPILYDFLTLIGHSWSPEVSLGLA